MRLVATLLAALLLIGCAGDGRTPVYVYSPHGRDQLLLLEHAFEQLRPDIDVRWLDLGSQEILDRLRFEQVNPQADVWFGGPATMFARGAQESLIVAYRPVWAASVDQGTVGPNDLYFPVYRTPAVIAYNNVAVPDSEAPRDWDDVLEPRWHDQVLIRDPMASGTAVIEDAVALVAGSRHPEAARAFIDYVGGVEAQILAADKVFRLPARLDLPAERVPDWVRGVERDMTIFPMDWELQSREGARWMGYWDQRVRHTGNDQAPPTGAPPR